MNDSWCSRRTTIHLVEPILFNQKTQITTLITPNDSCFVSLCCLWIAWNGVHVKFKRFEMESDSNARSLAQNDEVLVLTSNVK